VRVDTSRLTGTSPWHWRLGIQYQGIVDFLGLALHALGNQ